MVPAWLAWAALVGNALVSLAFLAQRNAPLWLLFTAFAVINIHSLIKRGRAADPPRGAS